MNFNLRGNGTGNSCICDTLVWPGLGSNTGTRAENDCLMIQSSSQVFLTPASSSS